MQVNSKYELLCLSLLANLIDITLSEMRRKSPRKKQPFDEEVNILVASENAEQRRYLTAIFEGTGYEVSTSEDGLGILRAIKQHRPNLIVLDTLMSGMDSWQVISLLRLRWAIPVIFISPIAEPSIAAKALECGADDYIVEPFSPAELVARVKAILRRIRYWS